MRARRVFGRLHRQFAFRHGAMFVAIPMNFATHLFADDFIAFVYDIENFVVHLIHQSLCEAYKLFQTDFLRPLLWRNAQFCKSAFQSFLRPILFQKF